MDERWKQGASMARARKLAFTLMELLMVTAVITLLFGLLLPALKAARDKAKEISCMNNLKQIGYSVYPYCDENDGFVIPCETEIKSNIFSWMDFLHYHDIIADPNLFKCPSVTQDRYFNPYGGSLSGYESIEDAAYIMNVIKRNQWNSVPGIDAANTTGWGEDTNSPVKIQNVRKPSAKFYITDVYILRTTNQSSDYRGIMYYFETDHGPPIGDPDRDVGNHHHGRFNAIMGDCHAESVKEGLSEPEQWAVAVED